ILAPRPILIPRPILAPRPILIPRPILAPRPILIPRCVVAIKPGSLVTSHVVLLVPGPRVDWVGPTHVRERRASASMRPGHIPQQFHRDALAAANVQVRKSFGSK
ncbi:MAG: hypothetical protein WCC47_05285, partial [Pseudonocardiaceae bacterium]